jgi:hypothetical protein
MVPVHIVSHDARALTYARETPVGIRPGVVGSPAIPVPQHLAQLDGSYGPVDYSLEGPICGHCSTEDEKLRHASVDHIRQCAGEHAYWDYIQMVEAPLIRMGVL